MTTIIQITDWIISTIRENIHLYQLFCSQHAVHADKSPDLHIIIPALQIIHTALRIEVVASVAERVLLSDSCRQCAGGADCFAPAVIFIGYDTLSGFVNQPDDVVLGVSHVVIAYSANHHGHQTSCAVVLVPDCLIAGALGYKQAACHAVLCGHTIHDLLYTRSGMIVVIMDVFAVINR